jgi:hypothetical protein
MSLPRNGCMVSGDMQPLYLFVFAAFVRRQVIPPGCKMLYLSSS